MRVKLKDPVNWDGKVTTIKDLELKGLIEYSKISGDGKKINGCRKTITKYFAFIKDINGTRSGWEINKFAYLSRIGQNI